MLMVAGVFYSTAETRPPQAHAHTRRLLPVACYMITAERRNASAFSFGGHRCEYLMAEPFDDAQYAAATPEYRRVINDPDVTHANNRSLNILHNHRRAWQRALNNTLTLVLEDDALPGQLDRVEPFVEHAQPNFLLKLYTNWPVATRTWRYVARAHGADVRVCECPQLHVLSNAAYVLDSRAAAVLLRHSTRIAEHTDQYIFRLGCARYFNLYGLSTNVVELSGRPSTHTKPYGISFRDVWTVACQVWSAGLGMCAPHADALPS